MLFSPHCHRYRKSSQKVLICHKQIFKVSALFVFLLQNLRSNGKISISKSHFQQYHSANVIFKSTSKWNLQAIESQQGKRGSETQIKNNLSDKRVQSLQGKEGEIRDQQLKGSQEERSESLEGCNHDLVLKRERLKFQLIQWPIGQSRNLEVP